MDGKINNTDKSSRPISQSQNQQAITSEFEQLIDDSNDAIRVINKNFTIRRINKAFAKMTGVSPNSVMGKNCWEVFPSSLCHTPECRANRVLSDDSNIQVEIERQKYDGTTIPCIVTTSPLKDVAGNVVGIIEQFRYITEKRQLQSHVSESEGRYRALIELGTEAGEAIVILQDIDNKEGIQTFVSDQWARITGYRKSELLGKCFFDLICKQDRQASIDRHRRKIARESIPGIFKVNLVRKDASIISVELTGAFTVYRGQHANVVYIRDITPKLLAQVQLKSSEENIAPSFKMCP
jgi:PAS domain S-box-containing protein